MCGPQHFARSGDGAPEQLCAQAEVAEAMNGAHVKHVAEGQRLGQALGSMSGMHMVMLPTPSAAYGRAANA